MTREWESTIYGLLSHPSTGRVLMLPHEVGWSLPGVQVEGKIKLTPDLATREMRRLLGHPVVAYRYVIITEDEQSGRKEGLFVLDGLERVDDLSLLGRWVGREDLSDLQFGRPDHLGVIDEYLRELETTTVPEFRQPWERRGWYTLATSWIEETLRSLGIEVVAQPEQARWWSLSSVLRVVTTHGDVFFKASARQPMFVDEPILLRYLGNLYPGRVPTLIASEPRYGWMLLGDAGAKLGRDIPIEQKVEMLQVFGGIQLDATRHVDELLNLGCVDRRPNHLIPRIAPLLEDELAVSKLAVEEISDLRRQVPKIVDMCSQLLEYSVPSTLIHGDLHLGNVASSNGGLTFFDWTDASIAHPFMDMFLIFEEKDEVMRTRLRDAYLGLWIEFEPMERLLELWSLCGVVHAIYHAISYQSILQHTEERSRGELGGAPAFQLRKALHYLRAQINIGGGYKWLH